MSTVTKWETPAGEAIADAHYWKGQRNALLAALRELEQSVRDLNEQSESNAADMLRRANRGLDDVLSGANARAAIAKAEVQRPVLRVGDLAYYDSMGGGMIPCRVISIRGESGAPGSASSVRVKTTAVRNGWPRGTEVDSWSLHVVPRGAYFPRRHGARIGYYTVEVQS